jgi:hypothetical protein
MSETKQHKQKSKDMPPIKKFKFKVWKMKDESSSNLPLNLRNICFNGEDSVEDIDIVIHEEHIKRPQFISIYGNTIYRSVSRFYKPYSLIFNSISNE